MTILEIIRVITLIVLILFSLILGIITIIGAIKKGFTRRRTALFVLSLGILFITYVAYNVREIQPSDWAQILLLLGLVAVTGFYAWRTHVMSEEMKEQRVMASRPVIIQKAVRTPAPGGGYSYEFEIYNAGNGPAIELEIFLLDKNEKLIRSERRTFLRAGDSPTTFYPYNLASHAGSTCYLLCRYQSIFSRSTKQSWYQTWLPFKPVKSQSGDHTYVKVESEELKFEEVFEKKSYEIVDGVNQND